MELFRLKYWSGWPLLSPGDLPNPGIEPRFPALQVDYLPAEPQGKPQSVTKSCPTLYDPMDCNMPRFPVLHYLVEFTQIHVHLVGDAIQPSHPLMPHSPPVLSFPSIRIFSNELALHIKWPKYWSFSFSISPSNEYSGLISFRTDWFDLLAVQGSSQESCPAPQPESIISLVLIQQYPQVYHQTSHLSIQKGPCAPWKRKSHRKK